MNAMDKVRRVAASSPVRSDKNLQIGIIGAGAIAQIAELPALRARNDVTLAGVVTQSLKASELIKSRWGIAEAFETAEAMVTEAHLDALFVLTPTKSHAEFVRLGLTSGLDVFCEKPLTPTVQETSALADLADETGRILMVGFNRRYAEVYQAAHERVSQQAIKFANTQKNRQVSDYRATFENAIHMGDLLRWFLGDVDTVTAHSVGDDRWAEDGTAALIRFKSGSIATLMAARCAGEWDERLEVHGEQTTIRVRAPDWMEVSTNGSTTRIDMMPRAAGWAQVNTIMGFGPEVDHFLECVRNRVQPLTNAHDSILTQQLMDDILTSAGLPLNDRS